MLTKEHALIEVKALDDEQGIVEAVVAVFGNIDLVGDRIQHGAFTKSIAEWENKNTRGKFMPFVYGHDYKNPNATLGKITALEEAPEGLRVQAQLFMDQESSKTVYGQFKEGVLDGFSFGYDVVKEKQAKDGANDLLELNIYEAGPTLIPANESTRLVSVKAEPQDVVLIDVIEVKSGRVFSAANEAELRAIRDKVDALLAKVTAAPDANKDSSTVRHIYVPQSDANAEEPSQANAEEPRAATADRIRAELDALDVF